MIQSTDSYHRRGWFGLAALLLLGLGGAMPGAAQEVVPFLGQLRGQAPVSQAILTSTSSSVTVAPGPCMPQGDVVSLAGNLHVVTVMRQGILTQVHLNLAGVQGMGQTGNVYIGTGSQKISNPTPIRTGD